MTLIALMNQITLLDNMKKALITGVSGQDGSLLASYLLSKDYVVYGIARPDSNMENIFSLLVHDNFKLVCGDLMNGDLLRYILENEHIDEIYNLASQSNVRLSYDNPRLTFEVTLLGTISLVDCVKNYSPKTKVFQAGSSSMFGETCDEDGFQRETTAFKPISPYASSKLFAHNFCQNYRQNHGLFICNGILYNHESTKKKTNLGILNTIANKAILAHLGQIDSFFIENIKTEIDFSHAEDCIKAMWLSLQHEIPDDYIIASGVTHTIEEACAYIFSVFGLHWKDYILTSENQKDQFVDFKAKGDPSKIKSIGWDPEYNFYHLLDELIEQKIRTIQ